MTKKKKILIVMMNLYNGGAEKSLVNLFSELDSNRYEIDLLLFQKKGLFLKQVPSYINILEQPRDLFLLYNKPSINDLFKAKNIKLILYRAFASIFVRIKYRNFNSRARRQIRWEKFYKKLLSNYDKTYDISLSYLENEPMRYVIDKTLSQKKYVWFHNDYNKLGLLKEYDISYYEKADKVITISNECLKVLNSVFPFIKNKSLYIPNISSKNVIMNLAKEPLKIKYNQEKFKIISIGRLSYEKGFDIAIEAANLLDKNKVDFQWFIIGDGGMKKKLNKLIKKNNLNNKMQLIGVTDNPYKYINSADILVQSSRSEGKSMVLNEAKILNKPFVVTKYSTVYDQATSKIANIVEISAQGIANGIMDLYFNKDKLESLKKNLKKEKNNNEEDIVKYYKLFDE